MGKTLDFVEEQNMMRLKKAQNLAISYADSNVKRFMKSIESALEKEGEYFVWNRAHVMDEFRRVLATTYALGYMDGQEKQELKTIHV
jgi:regulator of PEP synthase PpsR (kinase-PPPase family)